MWEKDMITTVFLLFSQNPHKLKDFIYNNGIFILLQLDIFNVCLEQVCPGHHQLRIYELTV